MELRDYHVHLERGPYTIEWMKRFLEEGAKRCVKEVGFSEHCYRFIQAKHLWRSSGSRGKWHEERATEDIEWYIDVVEKAKSEGLPVKLGIEVDYIPEWEGEIRDFVLKYPFDYVIGSVHWLGDFGFDNPDYIREWEIRDVYETHKEYFGVLVKAIESDIFDIIAHIDVIKVFGHVTVKDLTPVYEKVAAAMRRADVCAEISTAGIRKPVGEIYPSPAIMSHLKKYEIPVMINSDAHRPEDVGRDFGRALEYVKSYGFNRLCYFEKRKRLQYKI
ncbi:histidinol-phosphatase [Thermosediminibacter oceani]|uniref:Histidinol-phosphatase n=1 Tax=Thermosediminibacter oceani (strain ATCC BAA-1034 / DSM 16646 / JW/IW-1228P) TaxID=555079 RepID=D9RY75_THEOJ|nr:histidinol-phosphatase [Thermosediminibacter oceani]ADL08299.1 histidinol phosphate phosphatase HisJ family [Thermosediminibacter oceani DSM 16646]